MSNNFYDMFRGTQTIMFANKPKHLCCKCEHGVDNYRGGVRCGTEKKCEIMMHKNPIFLEIVDPNSGRADELCTDITTSLLKLYCCVSFRERQLV